MLLNQVTKNFAPMEQTPLLMIELRFWWTNFASNKETSLLGDKLRLRDQTLPLNSLYKTYSYMFIFEYSHSASKTLCL